MTVKEARARFLALAESFGSTGVDEENVILSVGREFLPACALAVLADRDAATVEYYEWLTEETQAARDTHDAVAAGRDPHGEVPS